MKHEECKSCSYNHSKSQVCQGCDGINNFDELYNADVDCKHNLESAESGGIKCTKCPGWFCF